MDSGLDFWDTAFQKPNIGVKEKEDKSWLVVRPL